MNVYQPAAQTVPLRSSGSRFPFSVVTTLNAGEYPNTRHCFLLRQRLVILIMLKLEELLQEKASFSSFPVYALFFSESWHEFRFIWSINLITEFISVNNNRIWLLSNVCVTKAQKCHKKLKTRITWTNYHLLPKNVDRFMDHSIIQHSDASDTS